MVDAYGSRTLLDLKVKAVEDDCVGGEKHRLMYPDDRDQYKMKCSMQIVGYYGARPGAFGEVLDSVFRAGDAAARAHKSEEGVGLPYDDFRRRLVAYYARKGPNPLGPHASQPTSVGTAPQELTWDSSGDGEISLVPEPEPCRASELVVRRCIRNPKRLSVAAVRREYGMVVEVKLSIVDYYVVDRQGKASGSDVG